MSTPTHDLKCHPEPFEAMADGRKPFEVRRDDRGFMVGHLLLLREWWGSYTGRTLHREVTYVLRGPEYGVPSGYVVMGLAKHDEHPDPEWCEGCGVEATKHDVEGIPLCGECFDALPAAEPT